MINAYNQRFWKDDGNFETYGSFGDSTSGEVDGGDPVGEDTTGGMGPWYGDQEEPADIMEVDAPPAAPEEPPAASEENAAKPVKVPPGPSSGEPEAAVQPPTETEKPKKKGKARRAVAAEFNLDSM